MATVKYDVGDILTLYQDGNLLAEAANRLYQGRAHLNISAHN